MLSYFAKTFGLTLVLVCALLLNPLTGQCQYPAKQLNIVVPFSPGGTTDRIARAMGPFLEKELGVPVILINRKGGGGIVGTKSHLKSDPDDGSFIVYTLQPYLSGAVIKGAFKVEDLEYLGLNYFSPQGLFVNRQSKYTSAKQLLEDIKANPNKVTMSVVPNSWSRVGNALFKDRLGAGAKEIPYQGGGKQRMAVVKQDVQSTISEVYGTLASASEELRCLAVFADQRLAGVSDVPTINEVLKEMALDPLPALTNFRFFMAKKSLKEKHPDRWKMLADALGKAAQDPEYQELMAKQKLQVLWNGPEETKKAVYGADEVLQKFSHFWKKK